MFVDALWLDALVRALTEAGSETVVTGSVLTYREGDSEGFAPSTMETRQAIVYKGNVGRDVLFTGNMAMYRSAFEDVGAFDERLGPGTRYGSSEDNDFGFRLLERGYSIRYVPDAVVYHRAWREDRDLRRLLWQYGRGQGAFFAKHTHLNDWRMPKRLLSAITRRLVRFPIRALTRPNQAVGDLSFALGMLSGAGEWWRRERNE